ncbi:hypothetical protein B0T17DRAFT_588968 [Bombardia bombarda]|uniref:Uncharacterized protein n=1 Tax=Bombardia bombarda TaxID=252184 RepID=A0AA39X800_9PEZI|nr:hypothetical protein B0T17DRAFT_588968 [Bombardia bombarda]
MCMQIDYVFACGHRAFAKFDNCINFGRTCLGAGGNHQDQPVQEICQKRKAPPTAATSSRRVTRASARGNPSASERAVVPAKYRELLAEVKKEVANQDPGLKERPGKRKRPGERTASQAPKPLLRLNSEDDDDSDEDIQFEDVVLPSATIQTAISETDDDTDDDNGIFEDVQIQSAAPRGGQSSNMELTLDLTAQQALMEPRRAAENRRKVVSKEEKERRIQVHKMHLLCLLSHVEQRNRWCNDPKVHDVLRPLLTDKMMKFLHPKENTTQFGRTEAVKSGLQDVSSMFKAKFAVAERGIRRALWAEEEEHLKNYKLPDDIESTLDKNDFLDAARALQGSRDVGAQIYCALLRSAGMQARLVCSLQPLSCVSGAPPMPKPRAGQPLKPLSRADVYAAARASLHPPSMTAPLPPNTRPEVPKAKKINGESPFPVYWVEVLNKAHQKWHPVDSLVTGKKWNPHALEPPASDRKNCLSYVVAFEADGTAKDVTRRYAKAYNSKTRRMRLDGLLNPSTASTATTASAGGQLSNERWWRKALRRYARPWPPTDLDQIEQTELNAEEAKEPMPRNIADFKDHPVYALERHLRRNEVLIPGAQTVGTVGAGSKAPLERIYRRKDVRVARSRDKWYRMGRVVRDGEEAVKVLPKRKVGRRKRRGFGDGYFDDGGGGDDAEEAGGEEEEEEEEVDDDPDKVGLFGEGLLDGVLVYTEEQTDLYRAPPVVAGHVPKNKFGNIDLYVPSMMPDGGVHVLHERAAHAAFVLGVDYAPALTGFDFKGRQGTAVLSGVVVAREYEEAVWAVVEGLGDLEAEMERERRARRAVRMWSRLLRGLRIRERGKKGKGKGKEVESEGGDDDVDMGGGFVSDVSEELFMGDDDEGENWPPHIFYLSKPLYSPKLTPAHRLAVRTRPSPAAVPGESTSSNTSSAGDQQQQQTEEIPRDFRPGPCDAVRILPIADPRHPANGQFGLFAARHLLPGELIVPYFGEMHVGTPPVPSPKEDGKKDDDSDSEDDYDYTASSYDLWLDREADVAVDAARFGNEARFANDYRGVPADVPANVPFGEKQKEQTKKPNAEFKAVWDARRGEMTMAVFVLPASKREKEKAAEKAARGKGLGKVVGAGIAMGEEILVSYGKGFWGGKRGEVDMLDFVEGGDS